MNDSISLSRKYNTGIYFLILFLIYLGLRILAWNSSVLVEDHDSIANLMRMRNIIDFDFKQIMNWNADATPLYPVWGAICSLPGWSLESSARFGSLMSSLFLFLVFVGVGKHITDRKSILFGLLFLCLNPVLIYLSVSILTEPTYIALVTMGFWVFLVQHKNPGVGKTIILGIICGLAFLNRTEGILYLAIFPIMQGTHLLFTGSKQYGIKNYCIWTIAFSISFLAIAVPQIVNVSYKMGTFAINGRQAWAVILNNPDGKSYEEKIYGLDYSQDQINIWYIQENPEVLSKLTYKKNITQYVQYLKNIAENIRSFTRKNWEF